MSETLSIELFKDESVNYRCIRLDLREDGSIKIHGQDMGEVVEKIWGDADYEFWVDVSQAAIPKLVFALLSEKYANMENAVTDFKDFCSRHNIAHKWDSWV